MGDCFSKPKTIEDPEPPNSFSIVNQPHLRYESFRNEGIPTSTQNVESNRILRRSRIEEDERRQAEHELEMARRQDGFRQNVQQDQLDDQPQHGNYRKRRIEQDEHNARINAIKRQAQGTNERKTYEDPEVKRMKAQREALKNDRNRNIKQQQARMEKLDDNFQRNQWRANGEQQERERQFQKVEQKHYERRQQIQDDFDQKREEMRREADQKTRERIHMAQEIQNAMQRKVWNDIIEKNWTARLNGLRNSNKDCVQMQYQCLKSRDCDSKEWVYALEILWRTMTAESRNMTELYEQTGKSFLLDIKKSVDRVAENSRNLIAELERSASKPRLQELSDKLNRDCLAIPTLAELKRNYYEEMRKDSEV